MLVTEDVITATLIVISVATKVILATVEVTPANLKLSTKVILTSNKLVSATGKIPKPLQSNFGH